MTFARPHLVDRAQFHREIVVFPRSTTKSSSATVEGSPRQTAERYGSIPCVVHGCREKYFSLLFVVLCSSFWRQSQGLAGAGDGEEYLEFALFTSDGGRTWLPVCGQSHASFDNLSEESISLHQEMCSFVTLALVSPAAVSLFPLTAAVLSLTTYLQETKPQGLLLEDQDAVAAGSNKRPPIYEVLEAHPFRFSSHAGGGRGTPQELEAVIVISKAIPRPTEVRFAYTSIVLCLTPLPGIGVV